jgi:PucR C-terminal helix-turn-helix domain/GGDEF-like domain
MPRSAARGEMAAFEERLRVRRPQLEEATVTRIFAISDVEASPDPAYAAGLRVALSAGLDYGLAAIAAPRRESAPVPVELLAQARRAARNGVSLEEVVRRYAAGQTLIADAVLDEAAAAGLGVEDLKAALRALTACYEHIVTAVSEEFAREAGPDAQTAGRRRCAFLRRLLTGEPLDTSGLGYDLECNHLAFVASGTAAPEALASLRRVLDRRVLLAVPEEQSAWAWLGGRRRFDRDELEEIAAHGWPEGAVVACGAPAPGASGWRLSHRQAHSALSVALRRPKLFTAYGEVALSAAVLRDEDLVTYLKDAFLTPLACGRGGGEALRETLRAYFESGRNVSSAASILGVSRQTVTSRLHAVEERLDRTLTTCRAEIEAALEIEAIS